MGIEVDTEGSASSLQIWLLISSTVSGLSSVIGDRDIDVAVVGLLLLGVTGGVFVST